MSEYAPRGLYPEGVDWHMPIPGGTLTALLDDAVKKFADRTISFMGFKLDYKELGERVDQAAQGLIHMGIQPGDRVGLFMPNTPYYPIMFFAALKAGATVVNFSSAYKDTPAKLETQILSSATQYMATMDLKQFFDSAKGVADKNILNNIIYCPMHRVLPSFKSIGFRLKSAVSMLPKNLEIASIPSHDEKIVSYENLIGSGKKTDIVRMPEISESQLAVIQYTSGSTGSPKGAMLKHFNIVANTQQIDAMFGWRENRPQSPDLLIPGQERFLLALPFFHIFGLDSLIEAIHIGADIEIIPDPRNTESILKALHKNKSTAFSAVPQILDNIVNHPDIEKYDLRNLKHIASGGAALPPNTEEALEKRTGHKIYQGYGSTESGIVSSNPLGDSRQGSIGVPFPQTEIRIVDLKNPDQDALVGQEGEICVRGPQVTAGYLNNPEATSKILRNGWYHTGDSGLFKENGHLYMTGRLGRRGKRSGFDYSPEMTEKGIYSHPDLSEIIAECAAIRTKPGTLGESLLVVIRFKPGVENPPDAPALRRMLKDHLTKQEMPREFRITREPLPKGDTGKPDWKKMEEDEAKVEAPSPQNPTL